MAYKAGKLRKLRKLNTGAGLRGVLSKGAIQFAQFAQKIGAGIHMKIRRYAADVQFSYCVRERANYRCEYCHNDYRQRPQGLDCSHLFSRGIWALRFTASNAFAHCMSCHMKLGNNPVIFTQWATKKLGEGQIGLLLEKSVCPDRAKAARKANKSGEIARHYKQQNEYLKLQRTLYPTKYLEFIDYE